MPIYSIYCQECGHQDEVFRAVKDYDNLPDHCGKKMNRQIVAPMVATDIQPYRSMVDGSMITSRSQHKEHLKQHQLVEVGNETSYLKPKPKTPPPGLKQTIVEAANQFLRET